MEGSAGKKWNKIFVEIFRSTFRSKSMFFSRLSIRAEDQRFSSATVEPQLSGP